MKIIYLSFLLIGSWACGSIKGKSMSNLEKQLTFGQYGHCLNSNGSFSKDGNWLVYDTRNDDSKIGMTGRIEMVNTNTGEIKTLYHTLNQSVYGPGVGAASFSPVADRVIFIHGIRNADKNNPYSFTRRTGVAIDMDNPEKPIFMDARDIEPPFTLGALKGGTHAHSWSGDGQWVSFTYNDFVIEQLAKTDASVKDMRAVGVMFPKVVEVKANGLENNNGTMFSVIVSKVTAAPKPGSDEINKAFEEGWIGKNGYEKTDGHWQKRAIAFQGNVVDSHGKEKAEIFVVDFSDESMKLQQRRISFLTHGIQGPRNWLKSTPDGKMIIFMTKDTAGFINAFGISPNGGAPKQLTFHSFNIQSAITISNDGKYLAYLAANTVYVTELSTEQTNQISPKFSDQQRPMGSIIWSPNGKSLAYNRYVGEGENRFLQIFTLAVRRNKT